MDSNLIAIIITALVTILSVLFGTRNYVGKFLTALKESTDVGTAINNVAIMTENALQDKNLDKGEVEAIKEALNKINIEINQAKEAWKNLVKK